MIHIDKVGVELEGGWDNAARSCGSCNPCEDCQDSENNECSTEHGYSRCGRCDGCEEPSLAEGFKYDGSVDGLDTAFSGECISPPMRNLPHLAKWIKAHYPIETNNSCGYHVHVSLRRVFDYSRLMNSSFYDYFLQEIEAWGKTVRLPKRHLFWSRLCGNNSYCIQEHTPEAQVSGSGNRYTQLNYCWPQHQTVECRLFPMFKEPKIAILAMYRLCEIVESWLTEQPRERSTILAVNTHTIQDLVPSNVVLPVVYADTLPNAVEPPITSAEALLAEEHRQRNQGDEQLFGWNIPRRRRAQVARRDLYEIYLGSNWTPRNPITKGE